MSNSNIEQLSFWLNLNKYILYKRSMAIWNVISFRKSISLSPPGVGSGLVYVGLAYSAADFFNDGGFLRQSAVGFSMVLFALKVVTDHYDHHPDET